MNLEYKYNISENVLKGTFTHYGDKYRIQEAKISNST